MVRRIMSLLALAIVATLAHGQTVKTYTQSPSGSDSRPLGYPVPLPVASLAPVDGFRDYASLHARHQQLDLASPDIAGHIVGTTQGGGRPIWAYSIGDPDEVTADGGSEGSAIVNAATHAREWQAPEVATGILEYLAANAGDRGFVRYILDNFQVVLVPIHNIDGFLQTQRYPTRVIVGQDPQSPNDWPRDGRMRRKNMRGVDENLTSFADHLFGIDLNRNHAPYWGPASSGPSKGQADVRYLTHYGQGPHSESENLALEGAIALADPARLRLGEDLHSFGMVYFTSNTGIGPLNQTQQQLVSRMQRNHAAENVARGYPNSRFYGQALDPPTAGIGAAAEFFAFEYRIPAWTLELEPLNGGSDYGGTGDSHDGFILPAAQVARVRETMARTQALAFYHQAGPPYLAEVEIRDAASGAARYRAAWLPASSGRALVVTRDLPLLAGRSYRAILRFSKPMRHRIGGVVDEFPGQNSPIFPEITLNSGSTVIAQLSGNGRWMESDMLRYVDDSYSVEFTLGSAPSGPTNLRVVAQDLAELALDARPQTPVGWSAGWSAYEDASGAPSQAGGADTAHLVRIASAEPAEISAVVETAQVREGGVLRVVLNRRTAGPAVQVRVEAMAHEAVPADFEGSAADVSWGDGESGMRRIALQVAEDDVREGSETALLSVRTLQGEAGLLDPTLRTELVDSLRLDIE